MLNIDTILIIFLAVIIAGGLSFLIYYLRNNVLNPSGKNAWKSTAGIIKRFAAFHGCRTLTNIRFDYDGRTHFIENILIGRFGLLLVHTLGGRGSYYGQIDGETWQRELGGKKEIFGNPIRRQTEAMDALRKIFSKEKLYNIRMENIVVLTSNSKKTAMYITNNGQILLPGKLSGYIQKDKFEADRGVDIDKASEIISGIRVKG